MKSVSLRVLPLPLACMMALYNCPSYAQTGPIGTDPAPYEIPLSIQTWSEPTVEPHPTNPYWVPNTPENPHPDQSYQWYRLFIGIGLNGGKAEQLLFDTGSTAFNIDAGQNYLNVPWLPLQNEAPPKLGQLLFYGDGTYGNQGASATMSSVEFYRIGDDLDSTTQVTQFTSPHGIPVSLNVKGVASGKSLGPTGVPGKVVYYHLPGFRALTAEDYLYYSSHLELLRPSARKIWNTAVPLYEDLGQQQNIDQGNVGGIFGAGPFGAQSVLGQMTASGYVVAANAQTGTPESCGSCAHVIMNLNPSIRAQFNSVVPWDGGSSGKFAHSGAPVQKNQFGQIFTYTLGDGTTVRLPTLLDSGTPELGTIYDDDVLAEEIAAGHIDPDAHPNDAGTGNAQGNVAANLQLVMTGDAPGAKPTTLTTASPFFGYTPNMLTVGPTKDWDPDQPVMLSGIQFFFANSVMYDLENMSTGYTPFFVSVAPISTQGAGYAIDKTMAAQGIAGIISGSGPLTVDAGGAAQLSNSNTYTGATRVLKDGWLGLAGPGSIASSSGVQADGTFDISRADGAAFIQSLSGAGTVALGANTLVLTQAHGSFGGSLVDGGFGGGEGGDVIVASGLQTLSGKNTFTGNLGIGAQGAVDLRGSVAASVQDAGLLSGNGHIGGSLAVTGAIAPGTGADTHQAISVDGSYHQQAGSTYVAQLDASGKSSQIIVGDRAVLDPGARLSVLAPAPSSNNLYIKGTQYVLLSSGQKLSGTYTLATPTPLSAVLALAPAYGPKRAYLDVVQTRALTTAAQTPNQQATLAGVQSLAAKSQVFANVANLPADPFIRAAADMLSGQVYPGTSTVFLNDSHVIRDAVSARLLSAGQGNTEGANGGAGPTTREHANGLTSWGQFVGRWGRYDSNGDAARITDTTNGFLVGADMPLGELARIGVTGGHTYTSFQSPYSWKNANNDTTLGIYGGAAVGGLRLQGGATYTRHNLAVTRKVPLLDGSQTLTSRHDASTRQAFAEAGYAFAFKATSIEPFAQGAHVQLRNAAFNEHGGGAALHVAGRRDAVSFSTLGAHFNTLMPSQGGALTAYGTLGWRHASGAVDPASVMQFAGGSDFIVTGVPLARNAWIVDAALALQVRPSLSFNLTYGGQLATHVVDSGFKAGVSLRF